MKIPYMSYSKMCPVFYEQRLQNYENDIENFTLKCLNYDI